jgi:hypothetical protein
LVCGRSVFLFLKTRFHRIFASQSCLIAQGAWNVGFAEGSERAKYQEKENGNSRNKSYLMLLRLFCSESFSAPFSVAFDLGLLMAN